MSATDECKRKAEADDLRADRALAESYVNARRSGPGCSCGHPANDHEQFSGMCMHSEPKMSPCVEYEPGAHFPDGRSAWVGQ